MLARGNKFWDIGKTDELIRRDYEKRVRSYEGKLELKENEKRAIEDENTKFRSQIDELNIDIRKYKVKVEVFEEEKRKLEDYIKSLRESLLKEKESDDRSERMLQDENVSLKRDIQVLEDKVEDLLSAIDESDKKIDDVKLNAKLNEENDRRQIQKAEQVAAENREKIKFLRENLSNLQSKSNEKNVSYLKIIFVP